MTRLRTVACTALVTLAALLALVPATGLAVVTTPLPPKPPITPVPTATAVPTAPPTAVPSPSPSPTPQGQLNLDPPAAPPSAKVHVTGSGFPAKASFAVLFDQTVVDSATSDAGGNFSRDITIPADANGPDHQVCAQQQFGKICANFHLEPAPSPSPSPEASPSPQPTPTESASPPAGRDYRNPAPGSGSPFDSLTRPPGIFFPILLLLAAIIGGLYWFFVLRDPAPVEDVTVLHRAAPERAGGFEAAAEPDPTPPPPAEAPPPEPIVYESPKPPNAPRPPAPPPHGAPGGADVPPDFPEPSD